MNRKNDLLSPKLGAAASRQNAADCIKQMLAALFRRAATALGLRARFHTGMLTLSAAMLIVRTAAGQNYSIDWHTIDGGGGASTGGVYSVGSTIGQPDAGTMSGDDYSLTGGFWSLLFLVQTPGAPLLSITLTTTNTVRVAWPSPSTGFTLQQITNGVASANWSNVNTGIQDDGTIKYLIVNPPAGIRYFRLVKPWSP